VAGGESAAEAGSRWQSRETSGGLSRGSIRRWKALWREETTRFDERVAHSRLASSGALGFGPGNARGDKSVRGSVTSSARGRQHRSRAAQCAGAVDRSAHQDRTTPRPTRTRPDGLALVGAVRTDAEAGGSPSSDAPPRLPEGGWRCRRVLADRESVRPRGTQTWESNHPWGARCVSSVAEVGTQHLSRCSVARRKARGRARDSLKRPASP